LVISKLNSGAGPESLSGLVGRDRNARRSAVGAGGSGDWQLYNLKSDPGETRDVAKSNPKKLKELVALWNRYAKQNGVILTGDGPYKKGKERLVEDDLYE